jgi:hypothetical protein
VLRVAPLSLLLLFACGEPRTPSDVEPPPEDDGAGGAPDAVEPPRPTETGFETHAHDGAGLAFDLARAWQLDKASQGTILATSPEGRAFLMFVVTEPENVDKANAAIKQSLSQDVAEVYFGPASEKRLGTLTAELAQGGGLIDKRPVELAELIIATPTGRVLIVVAAIEAGAPPETKRQARATLESIRPL